MRIFFTVRKWKLRVGKQKLWVGKQKLRVAIYTVENGPFIKKSNLFFFFSKFTRIIAVLKWFPAVRWLFSRLLKLKSPLVSLVAFKLLEPGKQPTHSWKPFSHGKISKSVEKKKNKVLYLPTLMSRINVPIRILILERFSCQYGPYSGQYDY